ncbi:MAG: hypothetical protein AAF193_09995 [Bacteroidota bacterium]
MAFTGKEGKMIPLNDASTRTEDHRRKYPTEAMGGFFGKDKIMELLNQTDAKGIRYYFAQKGDKMSLVMVAADSSENDITANVLNDEMKNPPYTGNTNPLNS